jgi:hypothetical protein
MKNLIFLCFTMVQIFAAGISPAAQAGMRCASVLREVERVKIADDEVALFAYGSLINIQSLEKTLKRPYKGPIVTIRLKGWSRRWDVVLPNEGWYYKQTSEGPVYPKNLLYLNVAKEPGKAVNGILIVIKKTELEKMDRREVIYDRVDVSQQLQGVEVEGGAVYTYSGKPEFIVPRNLQFPEVGLRRSYLNVVQSSLAGHEPDFQDDFHSSTMPFTPEAVFDDVSAPD